MRRGQSSGESSSRDIVRRERCHPPMDQPAIARMTCSTGSIRRCHLGSATVRGADAAAAAGLARDRVRPEHLDLRADRLGKDARGVPCVSRPSLADAAQGEGRADPLCLAAEGPESGRLRATCSFPSTGSWRRPKAQGVRCRALSVAVRSGDTPAAERPGWSASRPTS